MTYELTTLLTTIAAASASIVAILGGFIASKLISISGERSAVLDKLKSVDKTISFNQNAIDKLQAENEEDDALDFIKEHISNLFNGDSLDKVFDDGEKQSIPKDKLQPYWKHAEELCVEAKNEFQVEEPQFNGDGVPVTLAIKYSDDNFSYSVVEAWEKYLDELTKQDECRRNPLAAISLGLISTTVNARPLLGKYCENERRMEVLADEIAHLEFEKAQYELQKQKLKKPDGMEKGLIIFALFSVLCIVLPFSLCPFATESYCVFISVKLGCIGFFTIGLACIFWYLCSLLKWKDAEISKVDKNNINT